MATTQDHLTAQLGRAHRRERSAPVTCHLRSDGSKNARASKAPVAVGGELGRLGPLERRRDAAGPAHVGDTSTQPCTWPGDSISASRAFSSDVLGALGGSGGHSSRTPSSVMSSIRYPSACLRLPGLSATRSFLPLVPSSSTLPATAALPRHLPPRPTNTDRPTPLNDSTSHPTSLRVLRPLPPTVTAHEQSQQYPSNTSSPHSHSSLSNDNAQEPPSAPF